MSFSSYRIGLGLRSTGGWRSLSSGGIKLKSGSLSSGRLSAAGGSSVSRSSIKSAVIKALQSDVSDAGGVSDKANSGLTKEYTQALEAQARKDAQAGAYGKDGEADKLQQAQMEKYVSPDRDRAIAQVSKLLSGGSVVSTTARLSGLPYTASVIKTRSGTTAEIYDENGERFASYDSKTGQWKSIATKAETQFQAASRTIYDAAYRAEEAGPGGTDSAADRLDLRV